MIPSLVLPDAGDRHVLAAAIAGRCDVIVTRNLIDFPLAVLSGDGIHALGPDEFLCEHLRSSTDPFCAAARKVRERLKRPAYSVDEYLEILAKQGLVETSAALGRHSELI